MRDFLCRIGWHRYRRGVTGFVDRCTNCGKEREHFDDWVDY